MAPFEPFEDKPLLAVAVSGGADSLALTLLADRWAKECGGRAVGLTVDHGLRPASADEARVTGRWLGAHGIEHHILPWRGEKPVTGLQRRARDARYALLTDWCRRRRCLHLLTAHHRQDQAETVAIRQARQSGDAGLAAMAAVREIQGLRLLRPLLGIDKRRLEQTLLASDQPWLDDPSNDDPAFTRNRLRQAGLDVRFLAEEAERQGLRRHAADRRAAETLARHAILDPAGFALLDPAGIDHLPADLALDLMTRLLMTVGGRIYPPRRKALLRLFQSMRADQKAPRTLAHCLILKHRDRWLICREQSAPARLPLQPGRERCWDQRFLVRIESQRHGLVAMPLGDRARQGEKTLIQRGKARRLPGVVRSGLPAIFDEHRPIAIPHLGLYDPSVAPEDITLRFCPRTPLANAPFMPHITDLRGERTIAQLQR